MTSLLARLWDDAIAWWRGFNHQGVTEENPVVLPPETSPLRIKTAELPILADVQAVVPLHEWHEPDFTSEWNKGQLDAYMRRIDAERTAAAELDKQKGRRL